MSILVDEKDVPFEANSKISPIIYFASSHNEKFSASSEFYRRVRQQGWPVVFSGKGVMESHFNNDPEWKIGNCDYLNHVGRADDSDIYVFCQQICRNLINELDLSFDPSLKHEVNLLNDQISFAAADAYVVLLRSALMLFDKCNDLGSNLVYLHGPSVGFLISLARILEKNNIKAAVLISGSLNRKTADLYLRAIENSDAHPFIRIPNKNNTVLNEVGEILPKLRSGDVFSIVRAKDPVYLENIAALLSKTEIESYFLIDRFLDDDVEDALVEKSCRPDSYKTHNLTSKVFYFDDPRKKKMILAANKSWGGQRQDHLFGTVLLDCSFEMQGLSALLGHIIRASFYYRVFLGCFLKRPPGAILVSPSRSLEARTAVVAGKSLAIGSAELQCGTIARSRRFWRPNSDILLSSEPASAKVYREFFQLSNNSVYVVGSPRLDRNVASYKSFERPDLANHIRVYLALQTVSLGFSIELCRMTLEALESVPGSRLIIGFHPGQSSHDKSRIMSFAEQASMEVEFSDGDGLLKLAQNNICITFFSFMAIEAYAMGCKVVAVNPTGESWPFRLKELGVAYEAYTADELRKIIFEIWDNARSRRSSASHEKEVDTEAYVLKDSRSVERIDNIISKMIANQPKYVRALYTSRMAIKYSASYSLMIMDFVWRKVKAIFPKNFDSRP